MNSPEPLTEEPSRNDKKRGKPGPTPRKKRNYKAELEEAERRIDKATFCLERAVAAKSVEAKEEFFEAALGALTGKE